MSTAEAHALVNRVQREFNEMPGLRLTLPQASRLWAIEPQACQQIVNRLVRRGFLCWVAPGTLARAAR